MNRKATALLGAGVLAVGLAAPLAASAHADDNTLAFVIGAAVGQALDRDDVRYVRVGHGHKVHYTHRWDHRFDRRHDRWERRWHRYDGRWDRRHDRRDDRWDRRHDRHDDRHERRHDRRDDGRDRHDRRHHG